MYYRTSTWANVKLEGIPIAVGLTLSKRGDYVVRSAICLARHFESGELKKLRQVSSDMEVPRTFISQILGDLTRAGLAVSFFGKDGGYRLARPPEEINLLEIVEAGEGSLISSTCVLGDGPCRWEAVCPLHESWSVAVSSFRSELSGTSLADVAERSRAIEAGTYPVPDDTHRWAAFHVSVSDTVQVELAVPTASTRLRTSGFWLSSHVEAASAENETRVRVGPGGPTWLGKTVAVHLGEPEETDGVIVIPLTWEATGPSGLFPRLEGELRLTALDPERAELKLSGHYRPPLGRTGQILDETLFTHVAHATVRSFLRRVAQSLEEAPTRSPTVRGARNERTRTALDGFDDPLVGGPT